MDTIRTYLENMFARLPKTNEIKKLKIDMLANMEDKYNELKSSGKSENEAIGIVISEFGNIDELIKELGIDCGAEKEKSSIPTLSENEVENFLMVTKKSAKTIGIGVFLCIFGVAILIFINQLIDARVITVGAKIMEVFSIIPLFVLVAIAVGLFIYSGMNLDKFKYLDRGFKLESYVKSSLKQRSDAFQSTFTLALITGVTLCILSPIMLFVASTISEEASGYGVVALLLIVSAAVYLFIYYGMIKEGYNKLLTIDEYSKAYNERKEEDKVIGAVAAVIWPLAVCIFLVTGMIFNLWHINWIVFPITGLLFAMFSGAYSILKEKSK